MDADTEVPPNASVLSIVDSENTKNVQNDVQGSLKGAEKFIESELDKSSGDKLLKQIDLSEKPKSYSAANTLNENVIDFDQSEQKGKSWNNIQFLCAVIIFFNLTFLLCSKDIVTDADERIDHYVNEKEITQNEIVDLETKEDLASESSKGGWKGST